MLPGWRLFWKLHSSRLPVKSHSKNKDKLKLYFFGEKNFGFLNESLLWPIIVQHFQCGLDLIMINNAI